MIVRLPNGWVVPGDLRPGYPEGMELVGKPDGAIGPPNRVRTQGDDGYWHYRWPTRPPTEEELYCFHTTMVRWSKFDEAMRSERTGEIPLEYCEVLKEMFCANCERERVGVEGDFICVWCRYP